jgi:hypothetical protein
MTSATGPWTAIGLDTIPSVVSASSATWLPNPTAASAAIGRQRGLGRWPSGNSIGTQITTIPVAAEIDQDATQSTRR